jgi:hypothetical protein
MLIQQQPRNKKPEQIVEKELDIVLKNKQKNNKAATEDGLNYFTKDFSNSRMR